MGRACLYSALLISVVIEGGRGMDYTPVATRIPGGVRRIRPYSALHNCTFHPAVMGGGGGGEDTHIHFTSNQRSGLDCTPVVQLEQAEKGSRVFLLFWSTTCIDGNSLGHHPIAL